MVIGAWAVDHEDESGVILLNDFALGDRHSGRAGFEAKLREQGFTDVRILRTPEELEAARQPAGGKKLGAWSGSWQAQYPWHAPKKERAFSDLRALVLTNVVGQNGDALMALVYRDDVRLKYPDGYARTITVNERLDSRASVDQLIDLTEKCMRAYCSTATAETPQLTIHRVPAGLDDEGTRKWLESLPGVELVQRPQRPEGFQRADSIGRASGGRGWPPIASTEISEHAFWRHGPWQINLKGARSQCVDLIGWQLKGAR